YMRKPVLFYHFDFERFFKHGLLRPAGQTFRGDICKDKESLIDTIEKYIENGFKEKSAVRKKKGTIFTHIDDENNERIYDAIIRADRPRSFEMNKADPRHHWTFGSAFYFFVDNFIVFVLCIHGFNQLFA